MLLVLYHKTREEERGFIAGVRNVPRSGVGTASGGPISPYNATPDGCYGGIAAEIGC